MESARAPHCHRAHQCREHWHREEQGEDKGDDRIRIPVPVEWVLVWIVQVDAVVIMRLVRLTVRLLTIRLALHARVPARICARTGLLAALSIRPAARLLIAGPRRLLTIRLASLLRLCRATVIASGCGGILLSIRLGSAINIRVVIRPVLARHSTIFRLLVLPVFRLVLLRLAHGAPRFG